MWQRLDLSQTERGSLCAQRYTSRSRTRHYYRNKILNIDMRSRVSWLSKPTLEDIAAAQLELAIMNSNGISLAVHTQSTVRDPWGWASSPRPTM